MGFEAKGFEQLFGLQGFSDALLKNHFTLYQGYVANSNKLSEALAQMLKDGKTSLPEFAELNRRLGWEFNGMRLHELYFENLSKNPKQLGSSSKLYNSIIKEWDSFELWEKDFKSMAAMRGIGWVVLYYDNASKRLFNVWINEHDAGHFAGCRPLLVIDVFEHAFMLDYGLKRADYIEAFFKAIDWQVVEERFS